MSTERRQAAIAEPAAYLAFAARAIGDSDWGEHASRLAGETADEPASRRPRARAARRADATPEVLSEQPTYRGLARAGLDLVEALAAAERWDEAAVQARHLSRYFRSAGTRLHAVAGEGFDGLHAASRACDRGELTDFVELLHELFP